MEDLQVAKCKQEDCNIAKDGKCLEGLSKEECPHFYWAEGGEKIEGIKENDLNKPEVVKNGVKMYPGAAVSVSELKIITSAYDCNKIIILGESDSGKTTLLGYIFDRFQKGPFEDIYFSGSLTLRGFDERCHYSRASSNADIPHTEKTNIQAFDFLHISVKKRLDEPSKHLLLSDISGEKLRDAGHSSALMLELEMLKYADKIIFVIDGQKISDKKIRQATIFSAHGFIQKALDEKIFSTKTDLQVVLSKWDYFVSDKEFDFDQLIVNRFTKSFADRLGRLRFTKICASPKLNLEQIDLGFGVYDLFNDWIEEVDDQDYNSSIFKTSVSESTRYFLQIPF